jgi:hypothetical protein
MRLTPLKIQLAIIKAFYKLAIKSVKYYGGLVGGVNNTCLFKEIRLLRAYIDILRNFTIVGSTITCHCCVEGDYTLLLNTDLPSTESAVQFGCDNKGYMSYNNIGYPFTYWYDENNQKIVINFEGDLDGVELTVNNAVFTSICNITASADSLIESATINQIVNPPVISNAYGTWNGDITIYDGATVIESLSIPSNILDDPDAIVKLWNTTYPNWILYYDGTNYIVGSPLDTVDYSGYSVEFSQYEGGSDPGPLFPAQRFRTADLELLLPSNGSLVFQMFQPGVTVYQDLVPALYNNVQDIIDVLNENTDFQFSLNSNIAPPYDYIDLLAPTNSFAFYQGPYLAFTQDLIALGSTNESSPTSAFTATIPGFIAYVVGQRYNIEFTASNNATGPTLDISGLGPVVIYRNGSPLVNNFLFNAPTTIVLEYDGTNFNVITSSWEDQGLLTPGGVNPTLVSYSGTFEEGNIGPFVNDNPCEETIASQECLSNNDVSKIIAHIDKLAK